MDFNFNLVVEAAKEAVWGCIENGKVIVRYDEKLDEYVISIFNRRERNPRKISYISPSYIA